MTKTWLITGSSRGLGRALAEAVLAAGNQLVATARKPEQLADLVAKYGDRVRAVALDVTDAAAARAAVKAAVESFGRLDVVVNNAGYGDMASVEDVTDDAFRAQIDTNFYGTVHVTRAALPYLREQGAGHIIQITSVGGRSTAPGIGAYQSAKWAVEGFSGVLAQEVAPLGIKVTCIEPGAFRTDWAGSSMTIPPIRPEYEPTVGEMARHVREGNGSQEGDPAKAAQVMLQIVDMAEPPRNLILGSRALDMVLAADAARTANDLKWEHLSRSVDF